jgi:uncharacterized protein (DUF1015 family)
MDDRVSQALAKQLGLHLPRILIPNADRVDLQKWAVIACDQYTSSFEYWRKVEEFVGEETPSTLHMIFPEIYLDKGRDDKIIASIHGSMQKYVAQELFNELPVGLILSVRKLPNGNERTGMVLAVDLEKYEFTRGNKALIRATEETIQSRIPPRLKIRKGALIEFPHVLVLIDDPKKCIIEPLRAQVYQLPKVYDFDLMLNSGHLTGYHVADEGFLTSVMASLGGLQKDGGMLFAVGDGNHSLATAKKNWEELKAQGAHETDHPARYALVELMNIHAEDLRFEPIHRLLKKTSLDTVLSAFEIQLEASEQGPIQVIYDERRFEHVANSVGDMGEIGFFSNKGGAHVKGVVKVANPKKSLTLATLMDFLDPWLKSNTIAEIDYVHGLEPFYESQEEVVGFILPSIDKHSLFDTIESDGVLPRKTFSMGSTDEKRFYMEGKRIR